jgi:hypothetical protein
VNDGRKPNDFGELSDDLAKTMEISLALNGGSLPARLAIRLALRWWLIRNVAADDVLGLEEYLRLVLVYADKSYSSREPVEIPESVQSSVRRILTEQRGPDALSEEDAQSVVAMSWVDSRFPNEFEVAKMLNESASLAGTIREDAVQLSLAIP